MATKTYSEKLKDPRWQRKRLEILQRDNWTCIACKDKESTLHVHHISYEWGKEPWDYDNRNFSTLCESCHECEEFSKKEINKMVGDCILYGYSYHQISNILYCLISASQSLPVADIAKYGSYGLTSPTVLELATKEAKENLRNFLELEK